VASALVVVDVQKGMFDSGPQPHDGDGVVSRIAHLIAQARQSGVPVFFVQHDGGKGDPLDAACAGFPFVEELTPGPHDDVTVKTEASAFAGTDFEAKLRTAGVDHLVICGMQTDFCIEAGVRAAFERGFGVTLVSDGHTTYDVPGRPASEIIAQHNRELGALATLVGAAAVRFAGGGPPGPGVE
jgi:nicotinamidase-related amidase